MKRCDRVKRSVQRGCIAARAAAPPLAALALVLAPSAGQLLGQPPRDEVTSVSFSGNEAFSDSELRLAVLTRASSCPSLLGTVSCALGIDWGRQRSYLSPRILELDAEHLRLLYQAHGYRDAVVAPEVVSEDSGSAAVTFRISEGSPFWVGEVALTGDSVPPGLALEEMLPLGAGDPLSPLLLMEAADTLSGVLRDAGYPWAEVLEGFRRPRGEDTALVTYRVELGPPATFGPIRVSGNRALGRDAIVGRLPFREGQPYSERLLHAGQRNLYEVTIVSRAVVALDSARIETDSIVPIAVVVAEGDLRRVRVGGGFNSTECLNAEGRWTHRHFLGGGRILGAQVGVANLLASSLLAALLCSEAGTGEYGRANWLARLDFSQPSFLSPRASLSLGIFAERQSRKNAFVRDSRGLELRVSRRLGGAFASLRFGAQLNRLDAAEVTLCTTFRACTPDEIAVLAGARWLAPAGLSLSLDATDDVFGPTRGHRALVDLEWADEATGSAYSYTRVLSDASVFRELGGDVVLALRARAGALAAGGADEAASAPAEKRFHGGGANGVRGFAQGALGPRSLLIPVRELLARRGGGEPTCVPAAIRDLTCDGASLSGSGLYQARPIGGLASFEASAELRFRLAGESWGGVAFLDVGQVWPSKLEFANLEAAPGIGLRYNTALVPLRLDIAYSFRERASLQVVTSQIRPFDGAVDGADDRIDIGGDDGPSEPIDWVVADDLALLDPPVPYGDEAGFSMRRFQIHFAVSQAF